ncbi:hypothetical protein ACOMICROBIO_FLGHMIGD_02624 [Vibrio sp. B1FLJ16]|uniref:hypothetical protein n=1 Tax=Vibrio sp. B1FLJ16 TaxID=2751178 RepID=UPI001AF0C70B|nr:hypothetical protein [Vibrio sp. B1FLJ16]CAD7812993.1 hypothetical protein ACOMICROBIO_FLGHMIGD_02624 [Vibrio sp. B1FLJ16]CAE6918966.1 hypothetical protein ACOMICROBIO_FLGHMIGD_02624 [Vibrio sp. B1FLJ16]
MKKVKGITAGVPLLGALLLAGCGGSDGGNDSSASAAKIQQLRLLHSLVFKL